MRRLHTRLQGNWSSDVCSTDLYEFVDEFVAAECELIRHGIRIRQTVRGPGVEPQMRNRRWRVRNRLGDRTGSRERRAEVEQHERDRVRQEAQKLAQQRKRAALRTRMRLLERQLCPQLVPAAHGVPRRDSASVLMKKLEKTAWMPTTIAVSAGMASRCTHPAFTEPKPYCPHAQTV